MYKELIKKIIEIAQGTAILYKTDVELEDNKNTFKIKIAKKDRVIPSSYDVIIIYEKTTKMIRTEMDDYSTIGDVYKLFGFISEVISEFDDMNYVTKIANKGEIE